jgi:hypothetical protein
MPQAALDRPGAGDGLGHYQARRKPHVFLHVPRSGKSMAVVMKHADRHESGRESRQAHAFTNESLSRTGPGNPQTDDLCAAVES